MAKFLSRLFSGGSSFRGSHSSLSENANTTRSSNAPRAASSLENLSSYHIVPKELEKHKLHKAAWEGNLKKVQRLARPGQINVTDQHMRVCKTIQFKSLFCSSNVLFVIDSITSSCC